MEELITLSYRVTPEIKKQMEELRKKERWSMAELSKVATEYYLKLRGYEI